MAEYDVKKPRKLEDQIRMGMTSEREKTMETEVHRMQAKKTV